eukprot:gene9137-12323_t
MRWRSLIPFFVISTAYSMIIQRSLSSISKLRKTLMRSKCTIINDSTPKVSLPPNFLLEKDSKYFDFEKLESDIYKWWEEAGYFSPNQDSKKEPFVVPMPPPNVTGYLHMGHAIFVALQDILSRFNRMRGRPTLFLPGTDHAGIATQLVVERALAVESISKEMLGREKFEQQVWSWKNEKGGYITKQMRRLGASADWKREKFTLDADMSESVIEAFIRLHEKGLIYKGDYLVNWSPNLQTAVSDLEVEYSEENGVMYHFKYVIAGDDDNNFIPVATTRPETILGDVAVCVHPEDPRYKSMIGSNVKVPMTNRVIPVIADTYVDREFGSGALKITPAHDVNDYEIGKRYNLPMITMLNKDGTVSAKRSNTGTDAYFGLDRFACREKIWNDMATAGLTIKTEQISQRIPRSQRGGEVIEPMVSTQWFMKMDGMANKALEAVSTKKIEIIPERFEKVWNNWLENIKDWCISRQLWWGHRIPVYYIIGQDRSNYIVAKSMEHAQQIADEKYGIGVKIEQDEDVLDTWFSSGLWPFATVGWPDNSSKDFQKFYPASVLETGYDILFFWVARMVMMGIELTGEAPFKTIYLHGLVRDEFGQKMSKTKGNVIDPIDTIDKFGCDALRFSLVTGCSPGQDIPLSMERIESNRNFVNKLWNAGKFLQLSLADTIDLQSYAVSSSMSEHEINQLAIPERYIISRCHELVNQVTISLDNLNFNDAGKSIFDFLWDEYADWYIEASKSRTKLNTQIENDKILKKQTLKVLVYVWDTCLRLLHPFMPFLTETLWQLIPHQGQSLMISFWPSNEEELSTSNGLYIDYNAMKLFENMQKLVKSIRNIRSEYNTDPNKKLNKMILKLSNHDFKSFILNEKSIFCQLGRVDYDTLEIYDNQDISIGYIHLIVQDGIEAYIPQAGLIDIIKEKLRLSKQSEKLHKDIIILTNRLEAPGFSDKAPPAVVADAQMKLNDMKIQLEVVNKSLADLNDK